MTRERTMRRIAGVAAVLWMAAIFGLSTLPGSAVPGRFGTLGHFGLYAVLGALYLIALPSNDRRPWHAAALAVALASVYGITDEFHQSFTPDRVPDVADWIVDTAGALGGVLAVGIARWLNARRS